MKYRIEEKAGLFIPQYKGWFFWYNIESTSPFARPGAFITTNPTVYSSEQAARWAIEQFDKDQKARKNKKYIEVEL